MRRLSGPAVLAVLAVCLVLYVGSYLQFAARSNGWARHAGAYYHYRSFNHDWQGYLFVPAALVEWLVIRLFPEPFLPHPSWAKEKQTLLVQFPKGHIAFETP